MNTMGDVFFTFPRLTELKKQSFTEEQENKERSVTCQEGDLDNIKVFIHSFTEMSDLYCQGKVQDGCIFCYNNCNCITHLCV